MFCQYSIIVSLVVAVNAITQDSVNYIAANLGVKYDVISNLVNEATSHTVRITLTNTGNENIAKDSWGIYFCHIRMIEHEHLPNPNGYELGSSGLKAFHINGCHFKLVPTTNFQTINPGGSLLVNFTAQHWTIARTDLMPNWYVAAVGLIARTILSTAGESLNWVGSFDTQEKWKRYWFDGFKDYYNPYSPEDRLNKVDINDLKGAGKKLIPTPREEMYTQGKYIYLGTGDWVIVHHPSLQNEAQYLSEKLNIPISTTQPLSRYISLTIGQVLIGGTPATSPESYYIQTLSEMQTVTLLAVGNQGAFYSIQSLLSLLSNDSQVLEMTLKDTPRFGYRGMMIDLGRNFLPKESIFSLIQAMGMYKLNKLHLHLSDDEGWRLQIPGLDELTTIGSLRCHDPQETKCVIPQLGSGPGVGSAGSGYYTTDDYREILTLAKQHHIEVIPEIDMPGHAHAAIKSMEAKNDPNYFLADPDDNSTYLSVQMFVDNAMNPCINSTYTFVEKVIQEMVNLHQDISPLKNFQFGGDEVAQGSWQSSPICRQHKPYNESNGVEWMEELKEEFVAKVSEITANYNLDLGGWEDGFIDGNHDPYTRTHLKNTNVFAAAWQNVWAWGQSNRAYKLANAEYQVVMSQATHLYFDHPYEPDPEERGYYWAPRYTDTRKTFGFMPDTLYRNADVTGNGQPITEEELCSNGQCVPLTKPENIIGMQGQLWSETVRSDEQMDGMVYPRLIAVAERAWHKASWESVADKPTREVQLKADWEQFANTLGYQELARLDKMDIAYHIPPPGAKAATSTLEVKGVIPGLQMEYRRVGSEHWTGISGTISEPAGTVEIRTKSADGRRVSRTVQVQIP